MLSQINGYDHFGPGKCPQFDDTRMREHNEVRTPSSDLPSPALTTILTRPPQVEAARLAAQANLDDLTKADAAVLADEAPVRGPPIFPQLHVYPGAQPPAAPYPQPHPQLNLAAPQPPIPALDALQGLQAQFEGFERQVRALLAWR